MTISVEEFLKLELFILLIVLVIVFIVLGIRLIKTLSKVDQTLDDLNSKLNRVDGAFNVVGRTADYVDSISDKIVQTVVSIIGKLINRKKGNDLDE